MSTTTRAKVIGCVFVLAVLAYHRAPQGEFVWDDVPLIVDDARLADWSNAGELVLSPFWATNAIEITHNYAQVYRPIVSLAYMAQWQLFGANPSGFHIVSLLLHLSCILLVCGWLMRRVSGMHASALGLALVVFALHPSRVETVAWISGSTDLWMTAFAMLATGMWARAESLLRAAMAGALVGLAILAKEPAIVLPALWLTDAALLGETSPAVRSDVLRRWVVAVSVVMLAVSVRLSVVPLALAGEGAGPLAALHRVIATFGTFVARTVVPWPLTSFPAVRLVGPDGFDLGQDAGFAVGLLVLVGAGTLLWHARQRPTLRPYVADLLWFVLPLLPVMNLVDTNATTLVSDRFVYLPLVGVVSVLARLASRVRIQPLWVLALAIPLLWMSFERVSDFRSDRALWEHELSIDSQNLSALSALSGLAEQRGDHHMLGALCRQGYDAAFERQTSSRGIEFALCQLRALLAQTPDTDQVTLVAIREVLDRLMATGRIDADHGDLKLNVGVRDDQQQALFRLPDTVLLPRARAHARTGSHVEAAKQLRAILRAFPNSEDAVTLLRTVER